MHNGRDKPQLVRHGRSAAKAVDDMICGSHAPDIALSASSVNSAFALSSIASSADLAQNAPMLSSVDLLKLLADRKVKKTAIADVLGIDPAGVTRLYSGERQLSLDEAKKLVEAFKLEGAATNPLPVSVARLLVLYGADALGSPVSPDDPRVEELARDFRAFSMFATDPRVRESTEAVEGFFQGLRLAQDRTSGS